MVYDERTRRALRRALPDPAAGCGGRPRGHRRRGSTGLAGALDERLRSGSTGRPCPPASPRSRSTPSFADDPGGPRSAGSTPWPRPGRDDDFGRGTKAVEMAFHGPPAADNRSAEPAHVPPRRSTAACTPSRWSARPSTPTAGPASAPRARSSGPTGPIGGLYGAGNCVDRVFGEGYPGGGSTIGPGMVFGFLAGAHAGRRSPRLGGPDEAGLSGPCRRQSAGPAAVLLHARGQCRVDRLDGVAPATAVWTVRPGGARSATTPLPERHGGRRYVLVPVAPGLCRHRSASP